MRRAALIAETCVYPDRGIPLTCIDGYVDEKGSLRSPRPSYRIGWVGIRT